MSLTMGTGPFGHAPAGRLSTEVALDGLMYVEPSPRRIRGDLDGATVVDSTNARLLFEHGRLARYFFPREDVRWDLVEPAGIEALEPPAGAPGLDGHVAFAWDSLDRWREEDDEIVGHAPDPYHRIDVRHNSRPVRISLDGVQLAESKRARVVFETSLPPRWYLPREDVVADLQPSDLRTTCAYKGHADYWSLPGGGEAGENLAWTYAQPLPEAAALAGHVAFFDERVDVDVGGERQARPFTPWAMPGWWRGPKPPR